jgi:uncharacterized protein (TIGR02145 family)
MQRFILKYSFVNRSKLILALSFWTVFMIFMLQLSACEKAIPAAKPVNETSTMSDRDGNVYKTVKIGNQWWMAENLLVKTYRNGDSIHFVPSAVDWQNTTAACCINSSIAFGLLYNGYAVVDSRNIAPEGWHIASDEEWKTLEMNLGMAKLSADSITWRGTSEADKMKKEKLVAGNGGNDWYNSDDVFTVWPNNESGFTALPGGCRIFNGNPGSPGAQFTAYFWSSTLNNGELWYRNLDYRKSKVFRFYVEKRYGFSVRCVKD